MGEEVEVKFGASEAEFADLRRMKYLRKRRLKDPRKTYLSAIYYDTAERALSRKGLSLRVRREDTVTVQTLKIKSAKLSGSAMQREECEHIFADAGSGPDLSILPEPVKRQVSEIIGASKLIPVVTTDITREIWDLEDKSGATFEIAFDQGFIQAAGKNLQVREIEIEAKRGKPERLYKLALKLLDKHELELLTMSKSARGLALLDPKQPKHVKATAPQFDAASTVEEAFEATVRACLAQVISNKAAMTAGRAVEGLHQMRVGLRRLRSGLEAFRKAMGKKTLKPLEREAKYLARILGTARDHDVFLAELLSPVEEAWPEDATLPPFRAITEGKREAAWETVLDLVRSARFSRFVIETEAMLLDKPWREKDRKGETRLDMPITPYAAQELEKLYQHALELGNRLDELSVEERHELRKRLKKLRYGFSFFSSLFPEEKVAPQLKHLSNMQDVFGALNDFAGAHEMVESVVALQPLLEKELDDTALPDLSIAGDTILAFHQEKAETGEAEASKLWDQFTADETFWRGALDRAEPARA